MTEHEIEACIRVKTSIRKILLIFALATGSGFGLSLGVDVIKGALNAVDASQQQVKSDAAVKNRH